MIILTQHQRNVEIPQAILRYIAEKQTTPAQLAKQLKINEAYMSLIVNGIGVSGVTVIADKYYVKIAQFIGIEINQDTWRHFDTDNFKQIIAHLNWARTKKRAATIDGDTGAGKSYACNEYKKLCPNNTYVVKCYADENSKEFAMNIAHIVGVSALGTTGQITKRVADFLLNKKDAILVIDEAEHVEKKSGYINIIKSLADRLEDQVALVLCGKDINKILQKAYDKNKQNFKQVASRFSKREQCLVSIENDIISICEALNIHSKTIHTYIINRVQDFRKLKTLLTDLFEEAEKSQCKIDLDLVKSVYE